MAAQAAAGLAGAGRLDPRRPPGRPARLLIEDVDCVFKDQRTTTVETGVTLSGLLNALDGVSSREGRVLFLTTNHPEKLDPALVRPGRVDRKVELGYASPDQARRLFLWFYRGCGPSPAQLSRLADRFAAQIPARKLCMAAIQEHLLRHRDEPEAAAHEVAFEEIAAEADVVVGQVGAYRGTSSAHGVSIEPTAPSAGVSSA